MRGTGSPLQQVPTYRGVGNASHKLVQDAHDPFSRPQTLGKGESNILHEQLGEYKAGLSRPANLEEKGQGARGVQKPFQTVHD